MRLEQCKLTGIGAFLTAPVTWSAPEPDWVEENEKGVLPDALTRLYRRANFLSLDGAPTFLRDENHQLFSYFCMMLRGVKESLVDANQELIAFKREEAQVYDMGKERRGESWNPQAPTRSKKHLRLVLLCLCSSLDCIAELTALILPREVPGLKVGKAEFQRIEEWLKIDLSQLPLIVLPQRARSQELHTNLRPIVECGGEEKEWLPLAKLFRNKAAHLGTGHFREMGFHDANLVFYTFLPTRWPFLWEEHMKSKSQEGQSSFESVIAPLMRQDKITYLDGLQATITLVVETCLQVLDSAYEQFEQFDPDFELLESLRVSQKSFAFRAFQSEV